jgi:hypothetical protein
LPSNFVTFESIQDIKKMMEVASAFGAASIDQHGDTGYGVEEEDE